MLTSVFIAFSLAASLPGETEIARFKTAFEAGEAAFKKGEYGVAMALFDFADRQKATPEVAYDLAKCHEKISDVALSVYFYRLYLRRASAPTDAAEVNGRIQSILTQAATTQHGLFELDAPLASEIVVDGKRFPQGPVAIFLPAGQREVQLKFGASLQKLRVNVASGQVSRQELSPMVPPLLSVDTQLADAALPKPQGNPKTNLRTASYIAAGVGVAALATGAVFGALSASEAKRVDFDRTIPVTQARALNDSANGKALIANILFAAGGAAVASGALLFVFSLPEPGMKPEGGRR
jgi:hypothetical protein